MDLDKSFGFDWNEANILKNWEKHKVKHTEAEEVFVNEPKLTFKDAIHSLTETRYVTLGRTNKHRKLAVIFTCRDGKIRIISARDMNKKERVNYEQEI